MGGRAEALSQRVMTYYSTEYASPIGQMTLACNEDGKLVGLWLAGQKYFLGGISPVPRDGLPIFAQTEDWLNRYFAGEKPAAAALPLAPAGSAFRQEVWKILCEIPYGEVATYGEISRSIAARRGLERMSAQAVGGAVGHNPISVIIPCHRVVGVHGRLTGYAGGIDKKMKLLVHEGVQMDRLVVHK